MSFFDEEARALGRAVDETYGDRFRLTPMIGAVEATAADVVDDSRRCVDLAAVYVDPEAKIQTPNAVDVRAYRRPGVEAGSPVIDVSPGEVARLSREQCEAWWIGEKDILTRERDGASWRVMSRFVTASGVVRLKVNRLG